MPLPTLKGSSTATGASTNTLSSVDASAGDVIIVELAFNGSASRSITSVKWGASVTLTIAGSLRANGNLKTAIYRVLVATGGTQNIVLTLNGTANSRITVYTLSGCWNESGSILDRTAGTTGTSTAPNPGSTGTLRGRMEIAFVALATAEFNGADEPGPGTWDSGVTAGEQGGTADIANTVRLATGYYQTANALTSYTKGKTGLDTSVAWAAAVATFVYEGVRHRGSMTPATLSGTGTSVSGSLPSYTAGPNPIVVAAIEFNGSGAGVSGITCGGVAMTLKSNTTNVYVYELRGAYSGATIAATLTGGGHKGAILYAHAYDYVDPVNVPTYAQNTGTSTSYAATLAQPDFSGDAFDFLAIPFSTGSDISISPSQAYEFGGTATYGGASANSDRIGGHSGNLGPWATSATIDGALGSSTAFQQIVVELQASRDYPISLTVTAANVAALSRVASFPRSLAPVAVGVAVLARVASYPRSLAPVAVGVAALARVASYLRALSSTAICVVSLSRVVAYSRALTATSTVVASLARVAAFVRGLAASAVGAAALARSASYLRALAATATGAAVLSRVASYSRALAASAIGVAVLVTQASYLRALAAVAAGVASLSRVADYARALAASVVGVAVLARSAAYLRALAAVAASTPTLARVASFLRGLAATSTASPGLARSASYLRGLAATSAGSPALSATAAFPRALLAQAAPVASLSTVAAHLRALASQAAPDAFLSVSASYGRILAGSAVGAVSLGVSTARLRALDAAAVGVPSLDAIQTAIVVLAAQASGSAALSVSSAFVVTLGAVASCVATLSRSAALQRAIQSAAVGVPQLQATTSGGGGVNHPVTIAAVAVSRARLRTLVQRVKGRLVDASLYLRDRLFWEFGIGRRPPT